MSKKNEINVKFVAVRVNNPLFRKTDFTHPEARMMT